MQKYDILRKNNPQLLQDLNVWLQKAHEYLNEAQMIGVNSDIILRNFKKTLEDNNSLIVKINFVIVFVKNQISLMREIFNRLDKFNNSFKLQFDKQMAKFTKLMESLNKRLTQLNNMAIDPNLKEYLFAKNISEEEKTLLTENSATFSSATENLNSLYDYLSIDELLKIQQNYEIFNNNFDLISNFLFINQLKFFLGNLLNFDSFFTNVHQEFSQVNHFFYKDLIELNLYSNDNNDETLITNERYALLINFYELEMANLIFSLTNHYDRCSEAIELYKSDSMEQLADLMNVLYEDSNEATNVLNDLKLLFLKIEKMHNVNNINKLNKNLNTIYEELIVKNLIINDFLSITNKDLNIEFTIKNLKNMDFNFLKSELVQDLEWDTSSINLNLNNNLKIVNEILQFLDKFEISYYKLILQVHEKQQSDQKVKRLVNEFIDNLQKLRNDNETKSNADSEFFKYLPDSLSNIVVDKDNKKQKCQFTNENVLTQDLILMTNFREYPHFSSDLIQLASEKVRQKH